jgi:hypothetical protein
MKKNKTLFEKLWLGAPVVLWFSFQPLIRLGESSSMYFELSLALIYVTILALSGLPLLWRYGKDLLMSRAVWLVGAFVFFMSLSLFWTPNPIRGIFTTGVVGLLFIIFIESWTVRHELYKIIPLMVNIYFLSAVIVSLLAIFQIFVGVWFTPEVTLLCAGCVAEQFGFARPNAFTIEPQFLGSMLLAPALYGAWLCFKDKLNSWTTIGLILIITALFLTLSRGAIFSFILGLVILAFVYYRQLYKVLKITSITVISFILCLLIQGTVAVVNTNVEESFNGAVMKSLSQLSLGLIDIPQDKSSDFSSGQSMTPEPNFDGYIEESTTTRLELSRLSISLWSSSPLVILFGVGVGGAGISLNEAYPDDFGPREIVQNEFVSLLFELGLVGLLLFIVPLGILTYRLSRIGAWAAIAIILAFIAQWNFFSGYPNLLHVYLILILFGMLALSDCHKDLR